MRMKGMAFAALTAALVSLSACAGAGPHTAAVPTPALTASPTMAPPTPTPEPTREPGWYYGDVKLTDATTEITVQPEGELTELTGLAEHLPALETIRFGGREPTAEELALLAETFPQAEVLYSVTLAGRAYPPDSTALDLAGLTRDEVDGALEKLALLPAVRQVKLPPESGGETSLTLEDVRRFQTAFPSVQFEYTFTLCGKSVSTLDETLDLSHIVMADGGSAVRRALPCMTRCTSLDMDSCGVSDENMARIRDEFPNINVVWRVWFGEFYTCRTDVEKILASMEYGNITNANGAQSLRYCTRVRYLDLGHNPNLEDISFVKYMPDLEVAILAINAWTDATPLASCPKLEYLEIFNTKCTDLSPLAGLKNLRHLNVCYLKELTDVSPLMGMTWLERLWVGRDNKVPVEDLQALQAALPDCQVNITNQYDPTGDGWRQNERYYQLREQFDYDSGVYATKDW